MQEKEAAAEMGAENSRCLPPVRSFLPFESEPSPPVPSRPLPLPLPLRGERDRVRGFFPVSALGDEQTKPRPTKAKCPQPGEGGGGVRCSIGRIALEPTRRGHRLWVGFGRVLPPAPCADGGELVRSKAAARGADFYFLAIDPRTNATHQAW